MSGVPLRSLLLEEPRPLLIRKQLAVLLGVQEAIQLQQLYWLLDHYDSRSVEIDGRRWLKAELPFWREQFPWASESTIRRAFDNLKARGLIEKQRGREASVFTINDEAVDALAASIVQDELSGRSSSADGTVQIERSLCKEEGVEEKGEEHLATGAADGQLFAAPVAPSSPSPAPATKPGDENVEAVVAEAWSYYEQTFGDRLRIKTLTDPRRRVLTKAAKALGASEDPKQAAQIMRQAIDGLKSYRKTHPSGSQDVSLDSIFATNPNDGRSLTDKIEWWASQSESGNHGGSDNLINHPEAIRAKVRRYRLQVVEMHQSPELSGVKERGENALAWLKMQAKEEPVVEDGEIVGWRSIA